MRNPNLGSVQYQPTPVPDDPKDLPRYLQDELGRLADVVRLLAVGHIDVSYVLPEKPRQGDIRYADGVSWNPGGGEGIYFYNSGGVWTQMG
jgi:hypothetical protein